MADNLRCLVAICHNHESVPRKTAQSLMELGWGNRIENAKADTGFVEVSHAWFTDMPRVDALRNAAAQQAIDAGFSHLLFLDADMVWPTDVVRAMLRRHDAGIVSGLYFLKHYPHHPVALREPRPREGGSGVWEYAYDHAFHDVGPDGLRDEDAVGMGCTLIPVSVFTEIGPRPWFHYQDDVNGWPMVSEDMPFCQKAKAAGYRIAVDPGVQCGHVTTQMVTINFYRRVRQVEASRPPMLVDVEAVPV